MLQIIYVSNYKDEMPEHIVVGYFTDEYDAAKGTLKWIINNGKGGFDIELLKHVFKDTYDIENLKTPEEFVNHYIHEYGYPISDCNNIENDDDNYDDDDDDNTNNRGIDWDIMREIFTNDGDSYFADNEENNYRWDIIKIDLSEILDVKYK